MNRDINRMIEAHNDELLDRHYRQRKEAGETKVISLKCEFCGKIFQREESANNEYICPECGEIIEGTSEL